MCERAKRRGEGVKVRVSPWPRTPTPFYQLLAGHADIGYFIQVPVPGLLTLMNVLIMFVNKAFTAFSEVIFVWNESKVGYMGYNSRVYTLLKTVFYRYFVVNMEASPPS